MTRDQQRRLWFPAWRRVCQAQGWSQARGYLNALRPEGACLPQLAATWAAAEGIAASNHRAVTLDDLRHGTYVVALGRDKATLKLNDREIDTILKKVWRPLEHPDSISAQVRAQQSPEDAARERAVRAVRALAPRDESGQPDERVILGIARAQHLPVNGGFWEDLAPEHLDRLRRTLAARRDRL